VVNSSKPKQQRRRVVITTRDLARRMRKRLNKTTSEIEAAVAKVGHNSETVKADRTAPRNGR
jgi:hypothetical protein